MKAGVFTLECAAAVLGIDVGLISQEFFSCCNEILNVVDEERLAQNKPILNSDERIILIHETYRTYLDFRERRRRDGSGYFASHLCGTVKKLVQMEGVVGLPTVLAALKHDNLEELINAELIRAAENEADSQFKGFANARLAKEGVVKMRGNFVQAAKIKAKKKEEKRLAEELIDSGDYWRKLSKNVTIQKLDELMRIVRTLVEGVTKFRKAKSEATAEATFRRLLQVALEAIRTVYVKLADRAHNVETITGHTKMAQERIMAETEVQYLALARILRIRKMVQFYVEHCCRFFNEDLHVSFDQLAAERRSRLAVPRRKMALKFFGRNFLKNQDSYTVLRANFVNLDLASYTALLDKPFKDLSLDDLNIGPFDPMEEILVIIDLKEKPRLFALNQLAPMIEQKFASTDRSRFSKDIAPVGDPDNVLGMKLVCYSPEFGHLRFRINDKVSEARSKRGVLAEVASQETPEDVQEMIKAILSKRMGPFRGLRGIKEVAQVELLRPRISVRTPKGDIYNLPRGSNGLDFAAAIHGSLVLHMAGLLMLPDLTSMEPARPVDPIAPLEDGKVYIVQVDRTIKPQPEWLLFANTLAASAIRGYLSKISSLDGADGRLYLERLSIIFNISADELAQIIKRKYHKKSHNQISRDVSAGVINPVFVLAEHIDVRNNRFRSNISGLKRWSDMRQKGFSEQQIESDMAENLDGISKWEVCVSVPERAGSLRDFSTEFSREVGIKIDKIIEHIPGREGDSGRLVLLFDLYDSNISVYEFFVKLVKLNFKYPVRISKPIVKSLREVRRITGRYLLDDEDGAPDRN